MCGETRNPSIRPSSDKSRNFLGGLSQLNTCKYHLPAGWCGQFSVLHTKSVTKRISYTLEKEQMLFLQFFLLQYHFQEGDTYMKLQYFHVLM